MNLPSKKFIWFLGAGFFLTIIYTFFDRGYFPKVFTTNMMPTLTTFQNASDQFASKFTTSSVVSTMSTLISFQDALDQFAPKVSESCPLTNESKSFCPMKTEPCNKKISNLKEIDEYIKNHAAAVPLTPEHQHLLQVEQELLSHPALRDLRETPSLTLSTLSPLDGRGAVDGVVKCKMGQVIRLRADLVDGFSRKRTSGNDDVRAWIVEKKHNKEISRRAGAEVTDLKNGSYVVSFRCLWVGSSHIHVDVAYPREYLTLVLRSRKAGVGCYSSAFFDNNRGHREMTPCHSTPNVAWPCLCNLTAWNGASFFCGRPRDSNLTCKDHKEMDVTTTLDEAKGMSKVEVSLMSTMSRSAMKATIQKNLTLQVSEGEAKPAVNSSCRHAGPAITWTSTIPKGYFDGKGVWQTLLCHPRKLTQSRLKSCLTNNTVWFIGDSNTKALRDEFKNLLVKNKLNSYKCSFQNPTWYATETCLMSDLNAKFFYMRHEYTFYEGQNTKVIYRDKSVFELIDSLPSRGRLLVLVHYFLHTLLAHLSVAQDRLQKLRAAIKRLASRNPAAVFALRGPHISQIDHRWSHLRGGGVQAMFYLQMLKDVFRDMQDKVIFLDGWDMTIALENEALHPPVSVPRDMVNLLLDFACD